jgi:hypothetical protein
MITITIDIVVDGSNFIGTAKCEYIDHYGKKLTSIMPHVFKNINESYTEDLCELCLLVMVLQNIIPGHRKNITIFVHHQLIISIVNKIIKPTGIYKNFGNKLLKILTNCDSFIIKRLEKV